MQSLQQIIASSGIAFGTSGARGLVSDFTAELCAAFTQSFVRCMQANFAFNAVAIGIDNRPSSPEMAAACIGLLQSLGLQAHYYGVLPTPALAFQAMQDGIPAIMITGSHIPFDRNGIKFYRPDGEITKADEQAIISQNEPLLALVPQLPAANLAAANAYVARYTQLYPSDLLAGKHIGIYEHSSAGRDLYHQVFSALGARVTRLERSDQFVPIDTEAVSRADQLKAQAWAEQQGFDAIFSTDGDGDRPLLADEQGRWLRGDIVGLLAAKSLGIQAVAVPVSCNTAIEQSGYFTQVVRTKIGSPFVIEAFSKQLDAGLGESGHVELGQGAALGLGLADGKSLDSGLSQLVTKQLDSTLTQAGFEANGGFLLASDIEFNGFLLPSAPQQAIAEPSAQYSLKHTLKALPTRDALLPALAVLALAGKQPLSSLLQGLPARFTASDRLQNFAPSRSQSLLAKIAAHPDWFIDELAIHSKVANTDTTDGLRLSLLNGEIIHLRPSGNAPELRCYAEASSQARAEELVAKVLGMVG